MTVNGDSALTTRSLRRCSFYNPHEESAMARYARSASRDVKGAMHKRKRGTLKSGSGRKVKSGRRRSRSVFRRRGGREKRYMPRRSSASQSVWPRIDVPL